MLPTMLKDGNSVSIPVLGLGVGVTIDGTSASAASDVLDATKQSVVRLTALADLWIIIGATPTAIAENSCTYFPSGTIEYVSIPAGYKIAAIGGKLNITKCY